MTKLFTWFHLSVRRINTDKGTPQQKKYASIVKKKFDSYPVYAS